jgi:Rhamnan synthesis protein F
MKSICFFSSYFNGSNIPYYVKVYLTELTRHFTDVILLTNSKELNTDSSNYLQSSNILFRIYPNEGLDFGMWQKAFKEFNINEYDRIGLVNDSCILFRTLDNVFAKINQSDADYTGLVASSQVEWHLQSYFIILSKKAIQPVQNYFSEHGITSDFESTILTYEVGLSQHLRSLLLKASALFESDLTHSKFNPSYMDITNLIKKGLPLIKRKLIFGNYRKEELPGLLFNNFNFLSSHYINKINQHNKITIIDFYKLKKDYYTASMVIKVNILQFISQVLLAPVKLLRGLFRQSD